MKKTTIIFLFIISTYCSAQTPVLNIHTSYRDINNAYYKDEINFQNQFVGTWVYTDAIKTIRFRFIKKEMFHFQSVKSYYIDVLVGEMQYIENGVEKINSLANLDSSHPEIFDYSLHGSMKIAQNYPPVCIECSPNIERLSMRYNEPSNDDVSLGAYFAMRRADENGVQKIKIQYILKSGPLGFKDDFETPSTTTDFIIPYGHYTLIKE